MASLVAEGGSVDVKFEVLVLVDVWVCQIDLTEVLVLAVCLHMGRNCVVVEDFAEGVVQRVIVAFDCSVKGLLLIASQATIKLRGDQRPVHGNVDSSNYRTAGIQFEFLPINIKHTFL